MKENIEISVVVIAEWPKRTEMTAVSISNEEIQQLACNKVREENAAPVIYSNKIKIEIICT